MLQAVMTEPGTIEFQEVERPEIQKDQVLVEIKRIGICGSDIHVYHGTHPYTDYPVVQGHEVAGVIAEVGRQVEDLAVGDTVTFTPQVVDGTCYQCRHGDTHICDSLKVMGFQTDGAASEYFPIPARKTLKIPEPVSIDEAAMIEPTAVAVHALRRGGDVKGKKVVVLGSGTIGNLVGQVALASGASGVLNTDISDYKLDKARACGLEHGVNTQRENLSEAVLRVFGPDRADLILECVGVQATIDQAIENARKGTTIVVVGVFGEKPRVDLGLVQDHELNLAGTLMYQRSDYERAIELVERGAMHLDKMITHRFDFRSYPEAYEAIEASNGEYMKVMIALD
jgi:L-iditol 2-dehydrogenase